MKQKHLQKQKLLKKIVVIQGRREARPTQILRNLLCRSAKAQLKVTATAAAVVVAVVGMMEIMGQGGMFLLVVAREIISVVWLTVKNVNSNQKSRAIKVETVPIIKTPCRVLQQKCLQTLETARTKLPLQTRKKARHPQMKGNQLGRSPKPSRGILATDVAAVAVGEMMAEKTDSIIYVLVVAKVMVSVKWITWKKLSQVNKTIIKSRNTVLVKKLKTFWLVHHLVTALRSQLPRLGQADAILINNNVAILEVMILKPMSVENMESF